MPKKRMNSAKHDPPVTDLENGFSPKSSVAQGPVDKSEFKEAALLLAMWSILVTNEGVVRFIQHGQPSAPGLFSSHSPNRFAAAFLGGLFEVIFGLFGLCVGLGAGVLGYFNRSVTFFAIAVQNILGWYVFLDFVFVIPSYAIAQRTTPMMAGLTVGASKFIGVMGILTSVAFCLALQGGQFIFFARLVAYSSDHDFLNQRNGAKMRAMFWNLNYALAGLWVTIQAGVVLNRVGAGLTPQPFFAPPNVGRIPVYLLLTGLLMILWPLLGIGITMSGNTGLVRKYAAASFFVFLFVHVHFTIGQLGFLAGGPGSAGPAAGASLHNHLVMMLCFLGPYFMLKDAQGERV